MYGHVLMSFAVWDARKMVSHTHLTFIEMIDSQINAYQLVMLCNVSCTSDMFCKNNLLNCCSPFMIFGLCLIIVSVPIKNNKKTTVSVM